MDTLQAVVTAAQSGDLDAFGAIIKRFQGMAYASAYTMLGDAHLAEDAAQEAFIEAYINLPKLREPEAFPGWFSRIVFKQGDRLIRGKRLSTIPLEPVAALAIASTSLNASLVYSDPASIVEDRETQEFVHEAIEQLPEHERIVTLLFYGSGHSLKEIATFLEVPLSTIKKRLFDARKHLKHSLMDTIRTTLHEQQCTQAERYPARIKLLIAARLGDIDAVRVLLQQNPMLVNAKIEAALAQMAHYQLSFTTGHTALHEAAAHGHSALVNLLLDYGANIDAGASKGTTPLHEAVAARRPDMVKYLLSCGACIDSLNAGGLTPLYWAVMKGDTDITQLLLAHGAAVDTRGPSGRTPLHWAALKGYEDIVKLLLQHGSETRMQDELQRTAQDWAIARGYPKIVDMLQPCPL